MAQNIHYFGETSLRALWAKIKLADSSLDSSINKVLGNVEDSSDLATVYGAKKYAKEYADGLIAGLDAEESQAAGADGLALSITEVDGKITSISGSIAAETYDEFGAAATAKSEVIGADTDASTASTIFGAKKYAKEYADSVVDSFVDGLDSSLGHAAGADGIGVFVEIENGKLKSVDASIAPNTYDAHGAAATAEQNAKSYTDEEIGKLDSSLGHAAGADGIGVFVEIENGKLTNVDASIAPNTYDAHGAAATAKSEVIGSIADASTDNTIYGAKKYADAKAAEVLGTNADSSVDNTVYGAKAYADAKKQEAINTLIGESTDPSTANTVYGAKAYADAKIADLGAALKYKGSVNDHNALVAIADPEVGDVYNVVAAWEQYPAGTNYAWNGTEWDPLGGSIDLSPYLTKDNLIEITAAEVDAICI